MSPQICVGMCLHQDVTEESKKAKLQSSKIEQDLCEQAKAEMNVVKILMLGRCIHRETLLLFSLTPFHQFSAGLLSGPAESGKSTLIKQIKIIYNHGFSKPELISFKVPSISCTMLSPWTCMFQEHHFVF